MFEIKTEDGKILKIKEGETFEKISKILQEKQKLKIVAVKFNNEIKELWKTIKKDGIVQPVDLSSTEGMRIYRRALLFLIFIASKKLFVKKRLRVHHSIDEGLYFEIEKLKPTLENIEKLKREINELIKKDLKFEKVSFDKFDAIKLFENLGESQKALLFKYRKKTTVKLYKCGEYVNYFYEYMPPSTGYIDKYDIIPHEKGFILLHPTPKDPYNVSKFHPLPKLSATFIEYKKWLNILNVDSVGELNRLIAKGHRNFSEIIRLSEALHEKNYSNIADQICKRKEIRLVCLAGPSSSGKTTSAKRIALQLKVRGKKPVQISLDNYYLDYDKIPEKDDGKKDLESINALDLELLNKNLTDIINGKEVVLPIYNFVTGKREWAKDPIKLQKNQPVIIEGIHGLNEQLTEKIPREQKFKIYVSALIQMNLDSMNRIPTTDTRLVRRIVRDYNFRGASALRTLKMWPEVREGEELNIFPFQEEADVMFNSYLAYELPILKLYAEPLLLEIDNSSKEYTEAKRILRFLDYFLPMPVMSDIPRISILREFIGGSSFKY